MLLVSKVTGDPKEIVSPDTVPTYAFPSLLLSLMASTTLFVLESKTPRTFPKVLPKNSTAVPAVGGLIEEVDKPTAVTEPSELIITVSPLDNAPEAVAVNEPADTVSKANFPLPSVLRNCPAEPSALEALWAISSPR